MDVEDRFACLAKRVEAMVAQLQAELVFAFGAEIAVTLAAGRIGRTLELFLNVNFGMNLELDHGIPRNKKWARRMP